LINEIEAIIMYLLLRWLLIPTTKDRMALKIITDVMPKGVPQSPWISGIALLEDGDKKVTHLTTNCHVLCFFKALMPLIVILCKTIGNAGFSKGRIKNTTKSAKVFIRGGTLDSSEKKTQIEALSSRGMSVIHPANLKAPLPNSPNICVLVPDHLVRKVMIKSIVDDTILMKSIGLEPSSESGIPVLMTLKSLLKSIAIRANDNWLLLGKMDRKTQNTGLMILDLKEVKAPVCLTAADITCIQVVLDLIMGCAKLHGGAIVTLVHILVDVLNSFD
jgi:hypothetical protein